MTEQKMTEIAALTAAVEVEGMPADVREKLTAMLNSRVAAKAKAKDKPRTKSSEDIQKDNRAVEVAGIVANAGAPVTVKWLTENVDGWNINPTTGKVAPQSVTGCLNRAIGMGLIQRVEGTKPAAYAGMDYVAPVVLN